jgi:hypothetical protein
MFKIDKGIEIPGDTRGSRRKYPWKEMEVGDSFFVADAETKSISSVATPAGRRWNMKFRCSSRVESGVRGVRVWRIE